MNRLFIKAFILVLYITSTYTLDVFGQVNVIEEPSLYQDNGISSWVIEKNDNFKMERVQNCDNISLKITNNYRTNEPVAVDKLKYYVTTDEDELSRLKTNPQSVYTTASFDAPENVGLKLIDPSNINEFILDDSSTDTIAIIQFTNDGGDAGKPAGTPIYAHAIFKRPEFKPVEIDNFNVCSGLKISFTIKDVGYPAYLIDFGIPAIYNTSKFITRTEILNNAGFIEFKYEARYFEKVVGGRKEYRDADKEINLTITGALGSNSSAAEPLCTSKQLIKTFKLINEGSAPSFSNPVLQVNSGQNLNTKMNLGINSAQGNIPNLDGRGLTNDEITVLDPVTGDPVVKTEIYRIDAAFKDEPHTSDKWTVVIDDYKQVETNGERNDNNSLKFEDGVCYQARLKDACFETIDYIPNLHFSPIFCTETLIRDTQSANPTMHLSSSSNANGVGGTYEVIRDDDKTFSLSSYDEVFVDTDVLCGQTYCYRIRHTVDIVGPGSINPNGTINPGLLVPTIIESNQQCFNVEGDKDKAPLPINNVAASIDNDAQNVSLKWESVVKNSTVEIDRKNIGEKIAEYKPINSFTGDSYEENILDVFNTLDYKSIQGFCYRLRLKDDCDQYSAWSKDVCPTFLTLAQAKDGNTLLWNPYFGLDQGVKAYKVIITDPNGLVLREEEVDGATTTWFDDQATPFDFFIYQIEVVPNETFTFGITSNEVSTYVLAGLVVPSAFSPNNDGLNDVFRAFAVGIQSYNLTIYTRWGIPIFSTDDINQGWDGTFNGKAMETGSYAYRINAVDKDGFPLFKNGQFMLVN